MRLLIRNDDPATNSFIYVIYCSCACLNRAKSYISKGDRYHLFGHGKPRPLCQDFLLEASGSFFRVIS